jgi:hypothetical protein
VVCVSVLVKISMAIAPATTNAQVANAIAASLKQHSLPAALTPSLADVAGNNVWALQGTALLKPGCDPYNYMKEVFHPKPCIYGDTGAKRTIVIFGDSYVGNWLPALNEIGRSLGYRIAAFEFAGCITAFVPPTPGATLTAAAKACDEWHADLPAAVRAQKPVAVLAANGTPSWGVGGDPAWVEGIKTAFDKMTSAAPNTIRVLISISPGLPLSAPSCLAAYSTSIQRCDLTYTPGKLGVGLFSASLLRDQDAAAAAHATLLPTVQWFCLKDRCPAVIGNMLVYVDADHLTIVYSEYLAKVLQTELAPVLERR